MSQLNCYLNNKSIQIPDSTAKFSDTPPSPQNFSLPDSIVYYMAKSTDALKAGQKLSKTCKYFFSKNRIIFVKGLAYAPKVRHWIIYRHQWKDQFTLEVEEELEKMLYGIMRLRKLKVTSAPFDWYIMFPQAFPFEYNTKIEFVHQMPFSRNLIVIYAPVPLYQWNQLYLCKKKLRLFYN